MHKVFLLLASCVVTFSSGAQAAMLRPFSEITSGTVRLGDLFDQLGSTPDRILGKGPGPGERIAVGAAQLAAIARDFSVDWRPSTGSEQAVIERKGKTLPQSSIADAIRKSLLLQGAPEQSEIAMPASQPVVVPIESPAEANVTQCTYDPASGHFTALISITGRDTPSVEQRLSGTVVPLAAAAVATHRITRGMTITDADFRPTLVRLALLRGAEPALPDEILGLIAKHEIRQGQPLTMLDFARPQIVTRGSVVRMQLLAGGIALSAEGIAKEGGAKGDHIRVENPVSHALVQAEIVDEGEVRVEPNRSALTLAAAR
jgi:flagella basal body P-ring formation protein FlgA